MTLFIFFSTYKIHLSLKSFQFFLLFASSPPVWHELLRLENAVVYL